MSLAISLAVNIIVVSLLFLFLTRRLVRRLSPDESIEELQREVGGIVTEMNQAADRNITILEDKIEELRRIEERIDRKITLLNREVEKETQSATTYGAIVKEAQKKQHTPPESTEPEQEDSRPVRERILDLHRKGISPSIIASRVGSTVGEVELIIGLSGGGR
jgi:chromosome segregation ATPase